MSLHHHLGQGSDWSTVEASANAGRHNCKRATDDVEGDTRAGGKVTKELAIGLYHQDRAVGVMLYHAGGAIKGAHAHTQHPDKGQGFVQSFGKPASRPLPTPSLRSA